jgi:ABC-type xylose transport system permease subunit
VSDKQKKSNFQTLSIITTMKTETLTLKNRITSPTPSFFRKIRNIGLILGAVGGALLAAPITLPAAVITAAGYMVTAGLVASAVSATAVEKPKKTE